MKSALVSSALLLLSILLFSQRASAVAVYNPLGRDCLWVSQIEAVFLHESNKVRNLDPQAATCMTREGRSMLLNFYGCVKDMPDMQLMSVQCKRCVTKANCYKYVSKCLRARY